jgi:Putative lumazine-binding
MRPIRSHCRSLLFALAASVAPVSLQAQDAKSDVMAVVKRLFDGMRAGDSTMVRSVFHPQVRMITALVREGKPMARIETSVDGFVKAVGTPRPEPLDERIWGEKVEIDGPLASVWVDYALYIGERFSHCGIDHFLLVKNEAGEWKVLEIADTRRTEGCQRGG